MTRATDAPRRIRRHIENLDSPDSDIASKAERYLMRYYGARALDALIESCDHPNPHVRYRAVWALGHTRHPAAFETILRLTRDPDPAVCYDAAVALGVLGDLRAIEPLIGLMSTPDDVTHIHSAATTALVRLGKPAVPALIACLQTGSPTGRSHAACALGGIGDESAIEPLERLRVDEDPWIRAYVLDALEEIRER